jgi:hypothetical protein
VADSLEEAGDRLFTFTRRDPSQWKSARTSNAIEPLNGELRRRIKTQTVLPCAKTVPMLLRALLASGQIQMRKVDGCETLSQPIEPTPLDLAARETDTSHAQRPPPGNFHQLRDTIRASLIQGFGKELWMTRCRFELTDAEWAVIEPLLPNKSRGVARVDDRRVINGILWRFRTGSPWADIPERYGPHTTCYNRFVRWRKAGMWDRLLQAVSQAFDGELS